MNKVVTLLKKMIFIQMEDILFINKVYRSCYSNGAIEGDVLDYVLDIMSVFAIRVRAPAH